MDESDIQLSIKKASQWYEWMVWHNPKNTRYVMPGYPDLRLEHAERFTRFIEVKDIARSAKGKWSKSFSFSEIDDDQRSFLNKWTDLGFQMYFGLGKISPLGKTKSEITDIWVFPWKYWLEVESQFQQSIAYDWSLYEKRPADWQSKIDIVSLDPLYRLTKRQGKEAWQFDPRHPLVDGYSRLDVPYHLREKEERHTHHVPQPLQVPPRTIAGYSPTVV